MGNNIYEKIKNAIYVDELLDLTDVVTVRQEVDIKRLKEIELQFKLLANEKQELQIFLSRTDPLQKIKLRIGEITLDRAKTRGGEAKP